MPTWLLLFIVADIVVLSILVSLVVSGRLKLKTSVQFQKVAVDFRALMQLAKDKHERIGEYVRANWSGAPEQLPRVLDSLLAELERDAQQRGIAVERDLLKNLLTSSLRAHRLIRGRELEHAMEQVP